MDPRLSSAWVPFDLKLPGRLRAMTFLFFYSYGSFCNGNPVTQQAPKPHFPESVDSPQVSMYASSSYRFDGLSDGYAGVLTVLWGVFRKYIEKGYDLLSGAIGCFV